jgi:hypothetical protein
MNSMSGKTPSKNGDEAEKNAPKPETETDETGSGVPTPVRPAGPEAMRDPPESWDEVDEESDESFTASDPPSNY